MTELRYQWAVVGPLGDVLGAYSQPVGPIQNSMDYYKKHSHYNGCRLVKIGIVDNDPVIETKTEIVRFSFAYRTGPKHDWSTAGMFATRAACEESHKFMCSGSTNEVGEIVEIKLPVTTKEKLNK